MSATFPGVRSPIAGDGLPRPEALYAFGKTFPTPWLTQPTSRLTVAALRGEKPHLEGAVLLSLATPNAPHMSLRWGVSERIGHKVPSEAFMTVLKIDS